MSQHPSVQGASRRIVSGFTLIELALVLVILATFASLVVPRLALLDRDRLTHSARRLAATLSYLHDEAALRGRVYRVRFDLDTNRYTVETETREAGLSDAEWSFVEGWDPYARPTDLPNGVVLAQVETETATYTNGIADLYFLPEDAMPGITITLNSDDGDYTTLRLDGITGSVRIVSSADPS